MPLKASRGSHMRDTTTVPKLSPLLLFLQSSALLACSSIASVLFYLILCNTRFPSIILSLSLSLSLSLGQMEEYNMKRVQIPAFGNWDYCDEMPITQYFESAMQAGLIRGHFFAEDTDLFQVPAARVKPTYHYSHHHHTHKKVRKGEKQQQQQQTKEQLRKQGKVYDLTTQSPRKPPKAPKAVDEDLYKIPPELLHQKPKRKRMLRNLLSGCLGLNRVA